MGPINEKPFTDSPQGAHIDQHIDLSRPRRVARTRVFLTSGKRRVGGGRGRKVGGGEGGGRGVG